MTDITDSGERILLEKETPLMIARHFFAYRFAKGYVLNRSVLDIGCGEGYGSDYLAGFASEVTGIDYDKAIIDHAKAKYAKGNLEFLMLDAKEIDSLHERFDVICSFQCIEHLKDVKSFLVHAKTLLKEGGIFLCSTPNKKDASPDSHMHTPFNKFHVKEYLATEFAVLLGEHFKKTDIYGLRRGRRLNFYRRLKKIGLCKPLPASINPVQRFYAQIGPRHFVITKDKLDTALDFIAICQK